MLDERTLCEHDREVAEDVALPEVVEALALEPLTHLEARRAGDVGSSTRSVSLQSEPPTQESSLTCSLQIGECRVD